jgi:hypothetical protein
MKEDVYLCSYWSCRNEIKPETMDEGRDFGVMVSINNIEWRLTNRPARSLILDEEYEYEEECPSKAEGFLFCKKHFTVLRAEIIANGGISANQFKKLLGGVI